MAGLPRERSHQALEHQMRNVTHVPAIAKLAQIFRKMLPADVNVGALMPRFSIAQKPSMLLTPAPSRRVFLRLVIDLHMAEAAMV